MIVAAIVIAVPKNRIDDAVSLLVILTPYGHRRGIHLNGESVNHKE